jgi:GDP-4-dehydro-6-deoxy-D-mannose reductase
MRVLITGVRGFTGSHLAAHLAHEGDDVWGIDRPGTSDAGLAAAGVAPNVIETDLADGDAVSAAMLQAEPEAVYHLAGLTGRAPLAEMLAANVICAERVLDGAAWLASPPKVMLVSSAAVYGAVPPAEQPIGEDRRLAPITPYGISKAAMEFLGWSMFARAGLGVVVARPFNIVGPRGSAETIVGTVQGQLEAIAKEGSEPVLRVGDLGAIRDYVDVAFACRAYRALIAEGVPGEAYNVCSGKQKSVRDLVEDLVAASGVGPVRIESREVPRAPGDVDISVGDPSKLLALMAPED